MQRLYAIRKQDAELAEKRLNMWQQSAGYQINNEVKGNQDLVDAAENYGIAQGYINCMNDLGLLDKTVSRKYSRSQRKISKEIEKKCSELGSNRALM